MDLFICRKVQENENGYDVPTTGKPSPTSSSGTSQQTNNLPSTAIICNANDQQQNQSNIQSSSSSSTQTPSNSVGQQNSSNNNKAHVVGSRGSTNKALELIHQQQQQIRHQSCPLLANVNALYPLSTPKSCPTSTAVSPVCGQHAQLPSNCPSSSSSSKSSVHVKSMPNSLALSSITSCCVMSTGNKPFLPRHSLHPQATGKTPSSSFSTRVVANKSNNSGGGGNSGSGSSSSAAALPSSRKNNSDVRITAGGNESGSNLNPKTNILGLGISLPFKAFPISAKVGPGQTEPTEGPNYENANIGQIKLTSVGQKERRVLPDLEDENNPTAPYENLNMDYISKLTNEGFSQDLVIRALGISRNDIDMARDILTEFAGSRS